MLISANTQDTHTHAHTALAHTSHHVVACAGGRARRARTPLRNPYARTQASVFNFFFPRKTHPAFLSALRRSRMPGLTKHAAHFINPLRTASSFATRSQLQERFALLWELGGKMEKPPSFPFISSCFGSREGDFSLCFVSVFWVMVGSLCAESVLFCYVWYDMI